MKTAPRPTGIVKAAVSHLPRVTLMVLLVLLLSGLAACGQRGPLFLPEASGDPAASEQPKEADSETESEDDETRS
jgi:predicted small lipoprotein YifL